MYKLCIFYFIWTVLYNSCQKVEGLVYDKEDGYKNESQNTNKLYENGTFLMHINIYNYYYETN